MDYDRFSEGKSVVAITSSNIVTATDTLGEIIDTQYYGSIVVGIDVADVTTGQISAITFEEGDDSGLSDAADIDDSVLLINDGQLPVTAAGVIRVGTVSKKRYVRLKITTTGTVDITLSGMAELGNAMSQPKEIASSVLETSEIYAPGTEADSIVTNPKRTS
jgi:hypothetical protein